MSKKTFVIFGLLVIFLAVLIPWLAFRSDGDAARGAQKVPAGPEEGPGALPDELRHLPHALRSGHRRQLRAEPRRAPGAVRAADRRRRRDDQSHQGRVLNAVENGVDSTTTPGRMPPGILNGEQAEEVAEFVATPPARTSTAPRLRAIAGARITTGALAPSDFASGRGFHGHSG